MKIRKKKVASVAPRVGDMIATLDVGQLGKVKLLMRTKGTMSTSMSLRPREELYAEFATRNTIQAKTLQLVFVSCSKEDLNAFFHRRLYHFTLHTFSDGAKKVGEVVVRVFMRNHAGNRLRPHRRIERIVLSGVETYRAPGK